MNPKRFVALLAVGFNYQFEAPAPSFFQTAPSNEVRSSEALAARENLHPMESLKTLPGIVLLGSEVTTYTGSLFLRGASADHTLFIWNDLRADDFTSPAGSTDPFSFGTEFSNQIRVLKGPQSLLYGTQALGGVVLIDDDPDLDSSLSLAAGSLQTGKAVAELRHSEGAAHWAVGGSGLSSEGLSAFNATVPRGSDQTLERDGRTLGSGTVIFTYDKAETRDQMQVLVNASEGTSNDDVPPLDDINAKTEHRTQQWKLRYRKDWSEQLKSLFLVTGQRSTRDSTDRADAFSAAEYQDVARGARSSFLTRNTWRSSTSLWHFGFEDIQDEGQFYSRSTVAPTPVQFEPTRQEQSLYVVNDWNFSRSDFSWGVRGSCENSAACVSVYQLSYQWHWPDLQRSLYGIVSSGLKRPTLYQLYSSYGDVNLRSETSQAYELGVLQRFDSGHKVKLSFFDNGFANLIDYDFTTSKYKNLNKARTRGLEFLHQFKNPQWDTELSLASISAMDELQGLRLLRRPGYQAAAAVGRSFTEAFRWLNEVIYVGEREDTAPSGSRWVMPSITLWNSALFYKFHPQRQIFLRANNLGNSFYEDIHGYLTPGRFYWVGVKLSF
jgi:vitamin B12 transporter